MAPTQQDTKDTATNDGQELGVQVDADAERKHPAVTVLVTPGGLEIDADTWSDANNLLSAGARVKDGYPTGPLQTVRKDDGDVVTADGAESGGEQAKTEEVTRVPERPAPGPSNRSRTADSSAAASTAAAPASGGASASSPS